MGSSAKKKREKKADFSKQKLRVGKARPKSDNVTSTTFRSKAIVLNQQSLNVAAPSGADQFTHHVSLLTSKADGQRRDSLAYLTTYVGSRVVGRGLPLPTSTLVSKLCPLILDGSGGVRNQVLKLLRALSPEEARDHVSEVLPYVRAGMTHLAADVRASAVNVLAWLVEIGGEEVVSCAGGWFKTLNCFVTTLGWHGQTVAKAELVPGKWSTSRASFGKLGQDGRVVMRNLQVLAEFLRAGIGVSDEDDESQDGGVKFFPLWHVEQHMIPAKSNAYAYLGLFGGERDDENQMLEDREDRVKVFDEHFREAITVGLENAKKEGGEVGRAAALVCKVLREARGASE